MFTCSRYRQFWAVWNTQGELVCVVVYKRGAKHLIEILNNLTGGVS